MLQRSTRVDILPNVGDFRLLDRRALDALRRLRETQRYTKGMYAWIGFRKKEVLYSNLERHGGRSSFNLRGLCNLAVEGITSYTTAPLRLASVIGLISAAAAMLYALYFLIKTIAVGDGANDLPMLGEAGLGIAFHAKPRVVANAKQSINTIGLDGVLYFLGFKDSYLGEQGRF